MKIAIIDDHSIFRNALARSLAETGLDVLLEVDAPEKLFDEEILRLLDVAIIDVAMPPTHTNEGLVLARKLKEARPSVGVLILTAETATPQAIDLLRDFDEGVGYLRKDEVADVEELDGALRRICAGEQVIGQSVVNRLLRSPRQATELDNLSPQEREVLRLMAEGFSNSGISKQLHLAERTVEDHAGRIFGKLGISGSAASDTPTGSNKRVLAVLTWLRLSST